MCAAWDGYKNDVSSCCCVVMCRAYRLRVDVLCGCVVLLFPVTPRGHSQCRVPMVGLVYVGHLVVFITCARCCSPSVNGWSDSFIMTPVQRSAFANDRPLSLCPTTAPNLQSTTFAFGNTYGNNTWFECICKPAVAYLLAHEEYMSTNTKEDLEELFFTEFGQIKIRDWFSSQKKQASTYERDKNKTGASARKEPDEVVVLRQRMFASNAAVSKKGMRESSLNLTQQGGSDGEVLSWEDIGGKTPHLDTRNAAVNLEFEDEQRDGDSAGFEEEEEEDEESEDPSSSLCDDDDNDDDESSSASASADDTDGDDDDGDVDGGGAGDGGSEYEPATDGGGSSRAGTGLARGVPTGETGAGLGLRSRSRGGRAGSGNLPSERVKPPVAMLRLHPGRA